MDSSVLGALATVVLGAMLLCLWLAVTHVLDDMSGWSALGQHYRLARPFAGKRWWVQSGRMRGQSLGPLTVGANAEGLYLKMLWMFAPRAPALLIPWKEIGIRTGKEWLFFKYAELCFYQVPSARLRIGQRLAHRIAQAADGAWPGAPAEGL